MTIMRGFPLSDKGMISMPWIKCSPCGEQFHNRLEFCQILSAFSHLLDITGELGGLRDLLHFFQLSNMASNDSNS